MLSKKDVMEYLDKYNNHYYGFTFTEKSVIADYLLNYLNISSLEKIKCLLEPCSYDTMVRIADRPSRYKKYTEIQSLIDEFGPFKFSV